MQILSAPEDEEELFIYLVVSKVEVNVVLVKEKGKKQKPMFYTSKMLLDDETRYNSLEKILFL